MRTFTFMLLLSGFISNLSFAQTPSPQASAPQEVGVVTRVEGLVTVTQGDMLGNVFKDEVILQNARVVTTASGSTTIRLKNGCVIDLKPNQAITVDFRRECKAILASIQPVGATAAAGAVGAAGMSPSLANVLIAGHGVLTGVKVIGVILGSNDNLRLQRLSGS